MRNTAQQISKLTNQQIIKKEQEYAASMLPSPASLSPPDVRLQLFFLTVPVLSYPQATLNTFCQKSPALRRRIFCFFKHALRFQYLYFIIAHCYLQRKLTSPSATSTENVTVHSVLSNTLRDAQNLC